MQAKVSVIIVSRNSGTLLLECVHEALASSTPVEVIVSDRASTDFSIEPLVDLADKDPRVRVQRNPDCGVARAANAGLRLAQAPHVLFLGPDCLLERDTVKRMLAAVDAAAGTLVVGGSLRDRDGREQPGCRRHTPMPRDLRSHLRSLARCGEMHDAMPAQAQSVEAVSGAVMLVQRDALERIGGFDERYVEGWHDVDFCLRVRRAGAAVLFVPQAAALRIAVSRARSRRSDWAEHADLVRFFGKFHFRGWRLPLLIPAALTVALGFLLRAPSVRPVATLLPRRTEEPVVRNEVWVFGASSMIGRHLLPRLVDAGYRVRAFSRDPQRAGATESTRLTWQAFDIARREALPDVAGVPEIVIHLAPLALLPDQLEALAARGMRYVIGFGSTSRFTKRQSSHPKERELVAALDRAEQQIESSCTRLGVHWAVFRPTLIYSFGLDRNVSFLARFVRTFGFFLMPGAGRGLRQPVHADDLAKACVALLAGRRGWNRAYNLSGGETLSYLGMVQTIFRKLRRPRIIFHVPTWCWRALLRVAHLLPAYREVNLEMILRVDADMCFDHADATREFGFAPRRFEP